MSVTLPGGVVVRVESRTDRVRSVVMEELNPFEDAGPAAGDESDILVDDLDVVRSDFSEIQRLAGDGLVTATDGSNLYALSGDSACLIPDATADGPLRFGVGPEYPLRSLFNSVVRPTLHVRLLERDSVAIHAACVHTDGGAVLVTGWSESGKTETAIALLERGGRFISDKWTVVGPNATASTFPIGVGIRRWILPFAPMLAKALPRSARIQLAGAGIARGVSAPLRRMRPGGRVGRLLVGAVDTAVQLADRAALTPADVGAIYGWPGDPGLSWPIRGVVVLRTSAGTELAGRDVDAAAAARRLAWSAMVERVDFHAYRRRAAFALGWTGDGLADRMLEEETERIRSLLERVPTVEVSAPFPVDPGRIADVALAHL